MTSSNENQGWKYVTTNVHNIGCHNSKIKFVLMLYNLLCTKLFICKCHYNLWIFKKAFFIQSNHFIDFFLSIICTVLFVTLHCCNNMLFWGRFIVVTYMGKVCIFGTTQKQIKEINDHAVQKLFVFISSIHIKNTLGSTPNFVSSK